MDIVRRVKRSEIDAEDEGMTAAAVANTIVLYGDIEESQSIDDRLA